MGGEQNLRFEIDMMDQEVGDQRPPVYPGF